MIRLLVIRISSYFSKVFSHRHTKKMLPIYRVWNCIILYIGIVSCYDIYHHSCVYPFINKSFWHLIGKVHIYTLLVFKSHLNANIWIIIRSHKSLLLYFILEIATYSYIYNWLYLHNQHNIMFMRIDLFMKTKQLLSIFKTKIFMKIWTAAQKQNSLQY